MRVIVLGSGVIGTSAAYYLARSGHDVTVVDRQPGPALETSYANGGQISVTHPEPWANPGAPRQVLQWLARGDSPLVFRPRADWRQWLWAARFLMECRPGRSLANARPIFALALDSTQALDALRGETGIEYHHLACGNLSFYTTRWDFERAVAAADASLFKRVTLAEKASLELHVEAVNLFNHVNLGLPDRDVGVPGNDNPNAGRISETANFSRDPQRNLQFGVRLVF